jgi:L-amino acid N-acyltransferase YncA
MASIRLAILEDLPEIVGIYNQAILTHIATADTEVFAAEQRTGWFNIHNADEFPIYVFAEGKQVLGWFSVSPYRGRPALARTAEISYYVDYRHQKKGIGSALMDHAIADAPRINKRIYLAILLEWNTSSIHLLEKYGFERWGYLPEVAEFGDRICGQFYYGRRV